jgi:hypothetical protein
MSIYPQSIVNNDLPPPDGICDNLWGRNRCPNQATWILIDETSRGVSFNICCDVHKEIADRHFKIEAGAGWEPYDQDLAMGL